MFGWLKRVFQGLGRVLEIAAPMAASVAKASVAEKINRTDRIPDDLKSVVLALAHEAVDEALAEVMKEALKR